MQNLRLKEKKKKKQPKYLDEQNHIESCQRVFCELKGNIN